MSIYLLAENVETFASRLPACLGRAAGNTLHTGEIALHARVALDHWLWLGVNLGYGGRPQTRHHYHMYPCTSYALYHCKSVHMLYRDRTIGNADKAVAAVPPLTLLQGPGPGQVSIIDHSYTIL